MEIREVGSQDLEKLTELIIRVYRDTRISMWFDFEPTQKELEGLFNYKIKSVGSGKSVDLVAVEQGRILGECEILLTEQGGIVGIIIEKAHRRKGIGIELFEAGAKRACKAGVKIVFADVAKENAAAMRFFKKLGFKMSAAQPAAGIGIDDGQAPIRLELML
ncbi:MAG: GNAT family N-acetyltransferase [Candidatus Micrarchaeota archaeon]|nr:GNAT family N-acetyltransferase [Candidatus Micrarchaeota archaeon]MDE1848021.1 GNAT family N-acetyltransferase [Candidatus Micrarchaeota archaeon]MDE1864602.1 GNAT family N-acetyltransferase [Candidatus Micrarchaeota archaeon]